jgi:hypothetical protein
MTNDITGVALRRRVRDSFWTTASFLVAAGVVLLLVFGTSTNPPERPGTALVQR